MTVLSLAADSSCVTSRVDGSGLRITDVSSWATPRHLHPSLLSLLISGSGTLLISWLCTSTSLFVCSMAETIPISDALWFSENINWGFFTNRRHCVVYYTDVNYCWDDDATSWRHCLNEVLQIVKHKSLMVISCRFYLYVEFSCKAKLFLQQSSILYISLLLSYLLFLGFLLSTFLPQSFLSSFQKNMN